MPQPRKGPALGSNPSHQNLMMRNLARSLFEHERVKTTEAKAKALKPYAERLITKAKHGSIHHRRQVLSAIDDRGVVHKLFDEIGPRFAARNGGYTRVLKLGTRNGDGAPMAIVELVEKGERRTTEAAPTEEAARRRRLRRPARRRTPADEPEGTAAPEQEVADDADEEDLEEVTDVEDVDDEEEQTPS